jgi:ubiquitin-protein ligase
MASIAGRSLGHVATSTDTANITNTRVTREIFKLQSKDSGSVPDGVRFEMKSLVGGKSKNEEFTCTIEPSTFGGTLPVVLECTLSYDSYPFAPPVFVCVSGLEEFPTDVQKVTAANGNNRLGHRLLDPANWTPAWTVVKVVCVLVEDLRNPHNYASDEASDAKPVGIAAEGAVSPVCFTINDVIHTDAIPAGKFYKCEVDIGGARHPRYVAVNPHSLFILETHRTELGKVIVRSQRALLEIARVSYTVGKAVKVIYKASQGGDSSTFFLDNPEECVEAIKISLSKLGVKGSEGVNAGVPRGLSPQAGAMAHALGAVSTPPNRFIGGGRGESPFNSIKRLEREMRSRPTISVVRGIMDRYRRLIEQCSADPRPHVQRRAETLTRDLQNFLQRPEVLKTLSSQEQIEKQRHRRRPSTSMDSVDVSAEGGAHSTRRSLDMVDIDGIPIKSSSSDVEDKEEGTEGDEKVGMGEEVDVESADWRNAEPGWRGTPYHRKPGEVYHALPDTKSQVSHARVAESGTLLSGRVVVEVVVKPPPLQQEDRRTSLSM